MILSNEQRLGVIILFVLALAGWFAAALWPTFFGAEEEPAPKKKYRTWEERKDSMKRADSLRYAEWAAERELRYDSFRLADSLRRLQWKQERQQKYDSFRVTNKQWWDSVRRDDSLWRDSVGLRYVAHEKKDTVLDLNLCDTAELQLIRGIGAYTATQIVRYRERLGGYYSPLQLTDSALCNLHLDTLLHHFTADPADVRTINVNRCKPTTLARHPYIRFEQAQAIYDLRRRQVTLHSIEDLRSLPELTDADLLRLTPYLRFE